MGKWYTKPLTKRILVVAEAALSVLLIGAIIVLGMFSGKYSDMDYVRMINRDYTESTAFINDFYRHTNDILDQIRREKMYEKDGQFDLNQTIDLISFIEEEYPVNYSNIDKNPDRKYNMELYGNETYWDMETVENGMPSIEYRVRDILNFNEYAKSKMVIVCQGVDNTYTYYTTDEFFEIYSNKDEYIIEVDSDSEDDQQENYIIQYLENYKMLPDSDMDIKIMDKNGTVLFYDCWNFPTLINDDVKTVSGESLLDIVNNYPEFNGKLEELYNVYDYAMYTVKEDYDMYTSFQNKYDGNNTNYRYKYKGADDKVKSNFSSIKTLEYIKENEDHYKYVNITPYLSDFESNLDIKASEWKDVLTSITKDDACEFYAYVDTNFELPDSFYDASNDYSKIRFYVVFSIVLGFLVAVLLFVNTIIVTLGAGRVYEDNELHLLSFDNLKTEIGAAIIIVPSLILLNISFFYLMDPYNLAGDLLMVIVVIFFVIIMLAGYFSLVRRIKVRTLWSNSILKVFIEFLKKTWGNRGVVFKALVFAAIVAGVNLMGNRSTGIFVYLIYRYKIDMIVNILFVLIVIAYAIDLAKVKKGLKEIADGNLSYKIESESIKGPLKETAETINNIGDGMKTAVDEKISSERLKTDLITNVSHDIKTPLTSIINYVDILKREDIKDEKIKGYIDILDEKSKRLKTLTEDVLEASKASSGNIKLYMQNLDIIELLRQTAGEFEEKMELNGLSLICNFPEEAGIIYADGRRMWRIYENILNNAVKYSMKGTRVYLDVEVKDDKVYVMLKNISAYQLNISADQLTERFVRGDVSRTTEGTGLGLSISRSLTELQGGTFEIYLDGDLFKVTTVFPIVNKEKKEQKDN